MPLVTGTNSIDIEIRAQAEQAVKETERFIAEMDKAKADFKATQAEMDRQTKASQDAAKNNTMSWTDFRSMYQTVLDVARVGVQIWDETGQKFVDNAVKVGDLARMMGTTTEEASRLKEVSDDVGISFDNVARAMKLAEKDGFQPGIAGLQKMSDEYLKLAPGVDRAQFLLDRFGKSGDEMGKILEKGSASIGKMSDAIDKNMIVTEKAYQQARQYQISVDALKDSWDGFTYQVAPGVVESVTRIVDGFNVYFRAIDILKNNNHGLFVSMKEFSEATNQAGEEIGAEKEALLNTASAADTLGNSFESETEKNKAAIEAMKEMTAANKEELALISNMQSLYQGYIDKQNDLVATHDELLAKKQELIAQGYAPESQEIQDLNQKLAENSTAQQENAAAVDLAVKTKVLAMLQEQAAADGLSQAETDKLLDLGLKWGVYSQSAVDMARKAQSEMLALSATINDVPTEKTITVNVVRTDSVYSGTGSTAPGQPVHAHASGGSFMIPQSYGNEGFRMGAGGDTASGGEMVTITPKGGDSSLKAVQDALLLMTALVRNLPDTLIRAQRVAAIKG